MSESNETPAASTDEPGAAAPNADGAIKPARAHHGTRRRWIGWILLGAGILILVSASWVAFRSVQAYNDLSSARDRVVQLRDEVAANGLQNGDVVKTLADNVAADAASARDAVDDPLFRLATAVPWLGDNLDAVRELTIAVDDVATYLPGAANLGDQLGGQYSLIDDGAVNMALLDQVGELGAALDSAAEQSNARIDAIDRSRLLGSVSAAVQQVGDELDSASHALGVVADVTSLAPDLLGATGPRTYLVVFQNSAEPRATGGIFGSFVELHVNDGKVTIGGQGSSSRDLGTFQPPAGPIDADTAHLYSKLIGVYPMDVNFTPDFPSAAQRFAEMYRQKTGKAVDGVIALDPRTAGRLLEGRPPISLPGGVVLTADNLDDFMLSTVYKLFPEPGDVTDRDAFNDVATAAVFDELLKGNQDLRTLARNVAAMVAERRLLVWSATPTEQDDLLRVGVAGQLGDDLTTPNIGVFLNEGGGSKLGYYLHGSTTLALGSCQAGSPTQANVTVSLRSAVPMSELPPYVLGASNSRTMQHNVLIVAPTGGQVAVVTVDGRTVPVKRGVDSGRPVAVVTVEIDPGATVAISAVVELPATGPSTTPELSLTPLARPWVQRLDHTECS